MTSLFESWLFKIFHSLLFKTKLKDPSWPFVIGLTSTFKSLDKTKLGYMREGFWWGFVAVCSKEKIKFIEKPIKHFSRDKGEAGYKLKNLLGIIFRNVKGLLKIKFN